MDTSRAEPKFKIYYLNYEMNANICLAKRTRMMKEAGQKNTTIHQRKWLKALMIISILLILEDAVAEIKPKVLETTIPLGALQNGYEAIDLLPGLKFEQPVAIVSEPGGGERLFVAERSGRIWVITSRNPAGRELFLDISDRTYSDYIEAGLLGIALHPEFESNGYIFSFRNSIQAVGDTKKHLNILARHSVSDGDPNAASVDSETVVLSQVDPDHEHNGGDLRFGPDGYLYVALGDRGPALSSYQPHMQPIDQGLYGGIIRIDVDGRPSSLAPNGNANISVMNYGIPPDNPFVEASEFNGYPVFTDRLRTEFWAVGLRNPWRISFDSKSGELYCADVGGGRREEVNLITAGGNYGWPYKEGYLENGASPPPVGFHETPPLMHYSHVYGNEGGRVVVGGEVYHGDDMPELYGSYIFGDFFSGNIWALRHDGKSRTEWKWLSVLPGLASFAIDGYDGELLIVNFNTGGIHKLARIDDTEVVRLPLSLADTGLFKSMSPLEPVEGLFPYAVNSPLWSDGALKKRWFGFMQPTEGIRFDSTNPWDFPVGSVWVKHFALPGNEAGDGNPRPVETRILYKLRESFEVGTYKWTSNATAVLVDKKGETMFLDEPGDGVSSLQKWKYPSEAECFSCHTEVAGVALGFNTHQLNGPAGNVSGRTNQLDLLVSLGFITNQVPHHDALPRSASVSQEGDVLQHRVRSYLDANCSQCHQPNAFNEENSLNYGRWDARLSATLEDSGLLSTATAYYPGNIGTSIVEPGEPEASVLYRRMSQGGSYHMPPLATQIIDTNAVDVIREWIASLPNREWTAKSIGVSDIDGAAENSGDGFVLHGIGNGFSEEGDSLFFLYKSVPPHSSISARAEGLNDMSAEMSGVMVRANQSPYSPFVAMNKEDDGFVRLIWRANEESLSIRWLDIPAVGKHLKLEVQGTSVLAFSSIDGFQWVHLHTVDGWFTTGDLLSGVYAHSGTQREWESARIYDVSVEMARDGDAKFVMSDPHTQGDWRSMYGSIAVYRPDVQENSDDGNSFAVMSGEAFEWAPNVQDVRALVDLDGANRSASTWFHSDELRLMININDEKTRRMSLYFLDWDYKDRKLSVKMKSSSGHLLDVREVSDFGAGVYLQWDVVGNIEVHIDSLSGGNSVVAGLFLDEAREATLTYPDEFQIVEATDLSNAWISFGNNYETEQIRYNPSAEDLSWDSMPYEGELVLAAGTTTYFQVFVPGASSGRTFSISYFPKPTMFIEHTGYGPLIGVLGVPNEPVRIEVNSEPGLDAWRRLLDAAFAPDGSIEWNTFFDIQRTNAVFRAIMRP